jgi:hypothetical protein
MADIKKAFKNAIKRVKKNNNYVLGIDLLIKDLVKEKRGK